MCAYKPNLAWLGRIKPEISMKFLLGMYVLPEGPISLKHTATCTHTFTCTPASVESVSRHVLHVIVGEMEWKTGPGVVGSGCGFQSDEIQKPAALGITLVLPAPLAWGRGWGLGGGAWERKVGGHLEPRAMIHPAPQDPPSATQPTAPTLLPPGPEPQPDPTVVCFTTLNHG